MVKTVHNITLALVIAAFACMPSKAMADDVQKTQTEMEQNTVSVTSQGSTLHIKNADHMILEVFSITGEKVYTIRIDSPSKAVELDSLTRGCYIVRIGKYTRKIYLK